MTTFRQLKIGERFTSREDLIDYVYVKTSDLDKFPNAAKLENNRRYQCYFNPSWDVRKETS